MLEKIQLTNYRNLDLGEGLTFKPLTVFVGSNGSGKTNLIRVLRFLQDAWVKQPDEIRGITRFENAISLLGDGKILDRRLQMPSVAGIDILFGTTTNYKYSLSLKLDVTSLQSVSIRTEKMEKIHLLSSELDRFYEANFTTNSLTIEVTEEDDPFADEEDLYLELSNTQASSKELVLHYIKAQKAKLHNHTYIPSVLYDITVIEDYISNWWFYESSEMNLETIRNANHKVGMRDRILRPSGENLVLVLFNLYQDSIDFAETLTQTMKELFPRTRAIRPIVDRNSITLEWYLHGIEKPFFLDEMSDGTIRVLCWATILLSPRKSELIVIEEPEAHIHPAWLRVLAGWIRHAARETQVIISTHSSDLLDYFTDDLESVRVFHSSPEAPSYSVIREINRQEIQAKLDEGWQLGDLYRVGDPSVGGWP